MTDEELAAIEQRCESASPGPWEYYDNSFDGAIVSGLRAARPGERSAFNCGLIEGEWIVGGEPNEGRLEIEDPNVIFIMHARSDVPALIAEVRRLRAVQSEEG